jgi:hypothetical protein
MSALQQSFESFVASLKTDQLFKLQPKLKPAQVATIFKILPAIQAKKAIEEATIRDFLTSVSPEQLLTFKSALTADQYDALSKTIASVQSTP